MCRNIPGEAHPEGMIACSLLARPPLYHEPPPPPRWFERSEHHRISRKNGCMPAGMPATRSAALAPLPGCKPFIEWTPVVSLRSTTEEEEGARGAGAGGRA